MLNASFDFCYISKNFKAQLEINVMSFSTVYGNLSLIIKHPKERSLLTAAIPTLNLLSVHTQPQLKLSNVLKSQQL